MKQTIYKAEIVVGVVVICVAALLILLQEWPR